MLLKLVIIAVVITLAGAVLFGFIYNSFWVGLENSWPIALIISVFVALFLIRGVSKKMEKNRDEMNAVFKQTLVKDELNRVFDDVRYDPAGHFPEEAIRGLGVIEGAERISGNDMIRAQRNGVRFEYCDLTISRRNSALDDKRRFETRFCGNVIRLDAKEPFDTRMLLHTRSFMYISNANYQSVLNRVFRLRDAHHVQSESKEFNKLFDLLCSDPEATLAYFTDERIETLIELAGAVEDEFAIVLDGQDIYIFITDLFVSGPQRFEVNMSQRQPLEEQTKTIAAEAESLARWVDLAAAAVL